MTEKAKEFMQEVEKHKDLKKRLELLRARYEEDEDIVDVERAIIARIIGIAEAYGYSLTEDDFTLSDDEMEARRTDAFERIKKESTQEALSGPLTESKRFIRFSGSKWVSFEAGDTACSVEAKDGD